jgi:hypothetical protein
MAETACQHFTAYIKEFGTESYQLVFGYFSACKFFYYYTNLFDNINRFILFFPITKLINQPYQRKPDVGKRSHVCAMCVAVQVLSCSPACSAFILGARVST